MPGTPLAGGETGEKAVVLNLMLIGLAVTLDPLPLTAFLVVLPSTRGARKGAAFVWSIPGFMHTWFCVTQLRQVALL